MKATILALGLLPSLATPAFAQDYYYPRADCRRDSEGLHCPGRPMPPNPYPSDAPGRRPTGPNLPMPDMQDNYRCYRVPTYIHPSGQLCERR